MNPLPSVPQPQPTKSYPRTLISQSRTLHPTRQRQVREFQTKADALSGKFAFSFVDGVLVQALKQGHWLLIDEINLAPAETLERLSGLLESPEGSLVLTERGNHHAQENQSSCCISRGPNPATLYLQATSCPWRATPISGSLPA